MKRIPKLLIILLLVFCAVGSFAQKKKHTKKNEGSTKSSSGKHSSKKESSGKHSSKKESSGKHSSKKGSSGKHSSKKESSRERSSKHGKHHHHSSEEEPRDDVIIKGESSSVNWVNGDDAVTFMVPTSYLQAHAYIRNTTSTPLIFSIFEDGRWEEKTLPPNANADYSVSESRRFKMDVNGRSAEAVLYPGHFYNVTTTPANTSEITDVTETVTVH